MGLPYLRPDSLEVTMGATTNALSKTAKRSSPGRMGAPELPVLASTLHHRRSYVRKMGADRRQRQREAFIECGEVSADSKTSHPATVEN
ncbi:MAG: hypothetical protein PWP23_2961 [Candidatus Sumerlaeota bacterium]|jgi:hypothetical protein|nr:hypothetical protein [Candidatus Sumerlaeota bacterium]